MSMLSAVAPAPASAGVEVTGDDLYDDAWVPRTSGGKQVSCNAMRSQITKFLSTGEMTQTAFLQDISCNSNSYGRFMKLKGAHNGYQNGCYWGAARFFEMRKRRAKATEKANPAAAKRKREDEKEDRKKKAKAGASLVEDLAAVDLPEDAPVMDTVVEVKRKINSFLKEGGLTQTAFCRAIGVQSTQLVNFLKMAKKTDNPVASQPGAANQTYWKAYRFFEKKRLHEKKPKSKARSLNETSIAPQGFSLRHDNGMRWVFTGRC